MNEYKQDLQRLYSVLADRGPDWITKRLCGVEEAKHVLREMPPESIYLVTDVDHDDVLNVRACYRSQGMANAHASAVAGYEIHERYVSKQLPPFIRDGLKAFRVTMDFATGDHVEVDRTADPDDCNENRSALREQTRRKIVGVLYKACDWTEFEVCVWAHSSENAAEVAENLRLIEVQTTMIELRRVEEEITSS